MIGINFRKFIEIGTTHWFVFVLYLMYCVTLRLPFSK